MNLKNLLHNLLLTLFRQNSTIKILWSSSLAASLVLGLTQKSNQIPIESSSDVTGYSNTTDAFYAAVIGDSPVQTIQTSKMNVPSGNKIIVSNNMLVISGADGTQALSFPRNDANAVVNLEIAHKSGDPIVLMPADYMLTSNLSLITTRQNFTDNMISTLQTGADSLTLADMNEEGANMLMLKTRQQLGTSALSMASQAAQAVLRLF